MACNLQIEKESIIFIFLENFSTWNFQSQAQEIRSLLESHGYNSYIFHSGNKSKLHNKVSAKIKSIRPNLLLFLVARNESIKFHFLKSYFIPRCYCISLKLYITGKLRNVSLVEKPQTHDSDLILNNIDTHLATFYVPSSSFGVSSPITIFSFC